MRLDEIAVLDVIEGIRATISEPVAVFDQEGRQLGCTHAEFREAADRALAAMPNSDWGAVPRGGHIVCASHYAGDAFICRVLLSTDGSGERELAFIRTLIDLTLEKRELKNRLEGDFSDRIYLVNRLATPEETDEKELEALAMQLKYTPTLSRCALLFGIENSKSPSGRNNVKSLRDYFSRVLERSLELSKEDIFAFVQTDRLAIFKTVDSTGTIQYEQEIAKFVKSIIQASEATYGLRVTVGVGTPYEGLSLLHRSYAEAQFVLSSSYLKPKGEMLFVRQFAFEYLSSLIPREFLEEKFASFTEKLAKEGSTLPNTIQALSLNDGSLVRTAAALGIHRNTMLQRFGKLKKTLDIDPLVNDRDRMAMRQYVLLRNRKTVLHAGIIIQEGSTLHVGYQRLADDIAEMSGGSMALNIHTISHTGNNRHLLEILKSGSIDVAVCDFQSLNAYTEGRMSILELPCLFDTTEEAFHLLDGPIGKELYSALDSTGIIGLRYWSMGWRYISSRGTPVTAPNDLVGRRIRIMHKDIVEAYFRSIGAIPVKMNYGDISAALKLGLVDCQENPYCNFFGMKFYEQQNFANEIPLTLDVVALLTTRSTWNRLSNAQRELIVEASEEATSYQRAEMSRINDACRKELIERCGVTVNTIDAESAELWRRSAQPVYTAFRHQDLLGKFLEMKRRYHDERVG